ETGLPTARTSCSAPTRSGAYSRKLSRGLLGPFVNLLRSQLWTKESEGGLRRPFVRLIASAHYLHISGAWPGRNPAAQQAPDSILDNLLCCHRLPAEGQRMPSGQLKRREFITLIGGAA